MSADNRSGNSANVAAITIVCVLISGLVVAGLYNMGYRDGAHDRAVEELQRIKEDRCLALLMAPAGEPPKKIEGQP